MISAFSHFFELFQAKKALAEEREEHAARLRARLGKQKQEYEAAISRHTSMVDQLLNDKKNLASKVRMLITD